MAAFDFFFILPYFTLDVEQAQYLVTFAVMLIVALLISGFTVRTRQQAQLSKQNERRTALLVRTKPELATEGRLTISLESACITCGKFSGTGGRLYSAPER